MTKTQNKMTSPSANIKMNRENIKVKSSSKHI